MKGRVLGEISNQKSFSQMPTCSSLDQFDNSKENVMFSKAIKIMELKKQQKLCSSFKNPVEKKIVKKKTAPKIYKKVAIVSMEDLQLQSSNVFQVPSIHEDVDSLFNKIKNSLFLDWSKVSYF